MGKYVNVAGALIFVAVDPVNFASKDIWYYCASAKFVSGLKMILVGAVVESKAIRPAVAGVGETVTENSIDNEQIDFATIA